MDMKTTQGLSNFNENNALEFQSEPKASYVAKANTIDIIFTDR